MTTTTVMRTPDHRFDKLPDYLFEQNYAEMPLVQSQC
jgi:hypothetical protein